MLAPQPDSAPLVAQLVTRHALHLAAPHGRQDTESDQVCQRQACVCVLQDQINLSVSGSPLTLFELGNDLLGFEEVHGLLVLVDLGFAVPRGLGGLEDYADIDHVLRLGAGLRGLGPEVGVADQCRGLEVFETVVPEVALHQTQHTLLSVTEGAVLIDVLIDAPAEVHLILMVIALGNVGLGLGHPRLSQSLLGEGLGDGWHPGLADQDSVALATLL